eukprot:7293267-Lingulodinium_polyedra.AAC.1
MAKRAGSMQWHSGSWPGLLGSVADEDPRTRVRGIKLFVEDYKIWQEAVSFASIDVVIGNLAKQSFFSTFVLQELGHAVATIAGPTAGGASVDGFAIVARRLWQGWGHSKLAEDGNGQLRNIEAHATKNK